MSNVANAHRDYLSALAERKVQVVEWYDGAKLTFDQIALLLGVSRSRVHQIYHKAKKAQSTDGR